MNIEIFTDEQWSNNLLKEAGLSKEEINNILQIRRDTLKRIKNEQQLDPNK